MSEFDRIFLTCPICAESHEKLVPKRSIAHYVSMNNVKTSYIYRCHFDKCLHCVEEKNTKFSADDLFKILKEITLLDKKNGEWLSPQTRTRSDTTARPNHLAITPTFPDKHPKMTKYTMEKIIDKILKLDPDSQIEAHFEIGDGGLFHYHIYAFTKMSLCAQNNKSLSNLMKGNRIDLKTLKDSVSIGKWRNYIKKDIDKFQEYRLEFPSYYRNLDL